MRQLITILVVAATLSALPPRASAQNAMSVRGYGAFGTTSFAASKTFDAVTGGNRRMNIGGGLQATLWKGLFADGAFSQIQVDGERIFADSGNVYRLGIPLQVTMRPFDIAGGWRLTSGRLSPYVGGGVTMMSYKETSAFAGTSDDVSENGSGAMILGGADVALGQWLNIGGEVRYRSINRVLGLGGTSALFGEQSLGGFATSVRVSVGR